MKKSRQIKFNKIKDFFKRFPRIFAEKAFLFFFVLFLISLIFGSFIFYKYSILVKKTETKIIEQPPQLKQKTYEEILSFWQEKEKKLQEIEFKQYPDPFRQLTK